MRQGIEEVHWELTNRCNFHCVHCYLAGEPRRELSTEESLRLIGERESAGVLGLTLTGGEPTLRKDFPELYRAAHGRGFLINVFTNGSRITENLVELFLECPPQKVEITLNGISEGVFEAVTAVKGSFSATMDGIRRLNEAGITLGLKTNGMTVNKGEILAIKSFAQGLPNTFFKFDTAIMPRRDHDPAPTAFRLRPREILEIYGGDEEFRRQMEAECGSIAGGAPERVFTCAAGSTRFHISAWGDLHPCHTVRPIRRSLREMGFSAAVESIQREIAGVVYPDGSACGSCGIFSKCNSCPGLAHLEGRSSVLRAEYHCEVAHAVVEEFR
ncbi:MAG: radical SAM protein [Bdellovibrionales bacterium]|nr:radical SAM protein [Bdellovibrionales bacterium]